ncbi:MAG: C4-type zinc ribbon domain-containing protein [bacterium]
MKDTLALLVELQRLDDELRETREARSTLEKLRSENAESLAIFEGILKERALRIAETREFCEEKENELKAIEDDNRRGRARLGSISSQRELTALNKELETARRNNQKRSEELVKLLQELEEVQTDHRQKVAERDALKEQMAALEAELAARLATKEAAAVEHNKRRADVRARMDKALLGRYDRISRGRNGFAVAQVIVGNCGACNMSVPPQVFIRLQKGESLEACNNCQRLLVFVEGDGGEAQAG